MATVYGIMQQAKGHVGVYSAPDKGTTVTMYFPKAGARRAAGADIPLVDHATRVHKKAAILVVEDEDAVRNVAVRILTNAGYTVTDYGNPAEALDDFSRGELAPDILLTDVVMPDISGKSLSDAMGIPTVFMSGYTRDILAGSGPASGDSLLQKPFGEPELLQAIRAVADRTSTLS
jgi:CheY-like chemotaxis protein